jgi:hypothetical protein
MAKKSIKNLSRCLIAAIMVFSLTGVTALAQELEAKGNVAKGTVTVNEEGLIVLDDINDINSYDGADGTYVQYLDDGSAIKVEITTRTSLIRPALSNSTAEYTKSASATEYIQNKSYNYELIDINNKLKWSSEVTGTFHFNNTYVWCTSGTAYYILGDSSSTISYSKNTYSSKKVTGVSKYEIAAKITTPSGIYNISQYVGCNPTGETSNNMSY